MTLRGLELPAIEERIFWFECINTKDKTASNIETAAERLINFLPMTKVMAYRILLDMTEDIVLQVDPNGIPYELTVTIFKK